MQKIILGSKSPRRKEILQLAEIPFDIIIKETDESYPPHLTPDNIAMHIAKNKALSIKSSHGDTIPILCADTIIVVDNNILGKPSDRENAIQMLSNLSGRKHLVITGVCILFNNAEVVFSDTTEVEFHKLTIEQIIFYIDKYKPYDKAGAYAIQEWIGVIGIKYIKGDFYNVMGLPVSRVLKALDELGY